MVEAGEVETDGRQPPGRVSHYGDRPELLHEQSMTSTEHPAPPTPSPPADPPAPRRGLDVAVRWLQRMPFPTVCALAAGAVIVGLIAIFVVAPHPTAAGWIGLLIVAACMAALYHATTATGFRPVAVMFWAFVLVWVGFAPLLQIRDSRLPWPDDLLTDLFLPAQLILAAAIAAYWLGYSRRPRRSWHRAAPAHARVRVTAGSAMLVTAGTAVLALVAIPLTGGLLVRFQTRDAVVAALAKAGLASGPDQAMAGVLNVLPSAASLAALVLCLLCLRYKAYVSERSRRMVLGSTVVAVLLNVIFNNPLSASRFISLSTLLAAVLAGVRFTTQLRRTLFSVVTFCGLAFVYPLANVFRNAEQRDLLRIGANAYYTNDFDGFQQTVNTLYHVEAGGHTFGHHLLSAILFWIPRSIWHDKALPAGFPVAADRGYPFQNLALPLWAEIFLEFSWIGVVVVFFLYGYLARRMDRSIAADRLTLAATLSLIFAACQTGLLRGPTGAQFPFAACAVLAVIAGGVAYALLRRRRWRLRQTQ